MGPSRYTTWMASSSHHGKDTLASEKLKGPTTTIIFLGILLHASVQQLCLPPDKLEELTGLTRSWYFQAQGHQEGTALAHQQAPLCFKGGANREVLPLLPDQPVHQCQEAPPPHQQALTLRQELMLCEFHCEPCGQSFQYQSQYKKHVASRLHITFVEELSGFMQPVENEEAAIHDEQPLQMHSEDVFHAKQQPTADIDDSPDDVEDVVDDDDDDPDIVEWEMYHGDAWRNDSRFFSPMATSKDILAHIEILLDLFQFQHMVPDTTVTHLSSDSLISYGIMNAPVSDIVGLATPPVRTSAIRFWFCMDGQAARADGKRVMMLPLILFSDDTSGNQSKKWHKFESWYLSFAGLPLHLNARIENINFVCSSNSVSPLDLSEPIAQQLTALETEGVFNTFDASHHETVQVVAPLMCIVYDNPRASVLLNHLGSAALKHCPRCMTTRQENPDTVCALWTKDMALQQIAQMLTEADRVGMRKSFGLREDYNPLLCIPADLYQAYLLKFCTPYHLVLREIQARVRAFNTSGFSTKLHGSVCYYYQSFVGRDFKGWTQMALFILGPFLSDGQKEVLLAYSKAFRITYCNFFKPLMLDEWKSVCQAFVSAVKQHMPSLLEKQKTHLILHLVDSTVKFKPCSSFSAERFESFNSNVRMYNVFGNRLAPSRDIVCTLQHLRYICHGGNASERCGGALYFTPLLQHMVRGISMRELLGHKAIYQPGSSKKALLTAAYSVVFDMEQRERERKRSAKLCKSLDSFFPSKNVAIPFLDHILFNLYSRFSPLSTTATSLLTLVPAIICARNGELGNTYHDA
eukprot:Em0002g730a